MKNVKDENNLLRCITVSYIPACSFDFISSNDVKVEIRKLEIEMMVC